MLSTMIGLVLIAFLFETTVNTLEYLYGKATKGMRERAHDRAIRKWCRKEDE